MLKTRVITAAILISVIAAILYFSYLPLVMNIFVLLLSVIGIYELHKISKSLNNIKILLFVILEINAAFICFAEYLIPEFDNNYFKYILLIVFLFSTVLFAVLMHGLSKWKLHYSIIFIVSLIIPIMFRSFIILRNNNYGILYIVLFAAVCAVTDSGAYFIGRKFGKNKLAKSISPKKTIEGALGGTISALIIVPILFWTLSIIFNFKIFYFALIIYVLFASIVDQFGDLSLSVLKRYYSVKDYSNLLPGHGGVLDRFDSYMFVGPFTAIITCFIIEFIY